MCFLSLRERHVSSQFDDFSQRIHLAFTNVHLLIASRSPCSLCALILPRQTPFHFHYFTSRAQMTSGSSGLLVTSRVSYQAMMDLAQNETPSEIEAN